MEKEFIRQRAFQGFAAEFLDLFARPVSAFTEDVSYPKTQVMDDLFTERVGCIEVPEHGILRLEELASANSVGSWERDLADWTAIYEWRILEGFGDFTANGLRGDALEGLRSLAKTWAGYFVQVTRRLLGIWEAFSLTGDLTIELFNGIPPSQLGDALRGSLTPAYLRAHARVIYLDALLIQDHGMLREAECLIQSSDGDLYCEINKAFWGMSSAELGNLLKSLTAESFSFCREFFSNSDFEAAYVGALASGLQRPAWYLGYCFRQRLEMNPAGAQRLLKAIGARCEVDAAIQEYLWQHGWDGDRNAAVTLAWKSVAPKYFSTSGVIPVAGDDRSKAWDDPEQERLIGVASGLETYCRTTPAINALVGGASGALGAYLAKAGKNKEASHYRSQLTIGNAALTEAVPAADFDDTRGREAFDLSDDDLLSSRLEPSALQANPVAEEFEAKEKAKAWRDSLTPRELMACRLKSADFSEKEIAGQMGIGQQRVSQLLIQARRKWDKAGS